MTIDAGCAVLLAGLMTPIAGKSDYVVQWPMAALS